MVCVHWVPGWISLLVHLTTYMYIVPVEHVCQGCIIHECVCITGMCTCI